MYRLLVSAHERSAKFPKHDRHTTGVRLRSLAIDFFSLIIRANAVRGEARRDLLREASVALDLFKIMLRLAKDTGALTEKGYLDLANQSYEIGRMLGGWIKAS